MLDKEQLRENIISLFGIEALPEEKKIALLNKMSDLAQKRINLRILEQLDDSEKVSFIKALEEQDKAKIREILNNKGIELETMAKEEIEKIKTELAGVGDIL